jgi:hypothetical protein
MAKQTIKTTAKASVVAKKDSTTASGFNKFFSPGNGEMLFDKFNYALMILGALMIIIGFALMSGGASSDPKVFDADAVYSFQRITLAPMVIIGGFIVEIIAILKKPSSAA